MNPWHWDVLAVGALASGIYLLQMFIRRLIRLPASCTEHELPVVTHQTIEFSDIGEKCLHVEGPRFTTAFSRISFSLLDGGTNTSIRLKPVLMRTVFGGLKRAKLLLKTFMIDHAGFYSLKTDGIKEGADYSTMRIIVTKPYRVQLILSVLGINAASWLIIGGIALIILRLTHTL